MTAPRLAVLAGLAIGSLALAGQVMAAAPAMHCPKQIDVRNLMTVTEFDRAGLDKLDRQQLAALNAWLSRYLHSLCAQTAAGTTGTSSPSAAAAPGVANASSAKQASQSARSTPTTPAQNRKHTTAPSPTSAELAAFGAPPKKAKEPGRIESRIIGEFHGWTGDTIFRLENGQVWKQAGPGYFRIDLKNPKVVIKKLLIGYVLLVHGYAKEVFVRRIQ